MIWKILILIISLGGCVEHKCYPKQDEGIKQAENFCKQLKTDKDLCNKIKIYEKNICSFIEEKNICRPIGENVNTFLRIPFVDCNNQPREQCNAIPNCEWTFMDPTNMIFSYPFLAETIRSPK
ncbi:MAG: hypothetical protein KC505_05745 [Myxococcales bacterium]|nr:hypothetical protein [Myxococcales bacterium]